MTSDYKSRDQGATLPRHHWGRYDWSTYSSGFCGTVLYGLTFNGRPALPGHMISTMESRLNAKLRAQNWDIGQFLSEAPETISFLYNAIMDIVAILRAVKSRRFKNYDIRRVPPSLASRMKGTKVGTDHEVRAVHRTRTISKIQRAKSVSSAYLAVLYGILPILSDIQSAMQLLEQGVSALEKKPLTVTAEVSEPVPPPRVNTTVIDMGSSFVGEWGVKGEVNCFVDSPLQTTLDGMGLLDPMSIAWNLLPLSFVIDWFLPVGAFVSGLSGHWGLRFSHGYRTSYVKWTADFRFARGKVFVSGNPAHITGRLKGFERWTYIGFPIPVPYVKGMDNLTKDYDKAITLLALAVQRVL